MFEGEKLEEGTEEEEPKSEDDESQVQLKTSSSASVAWQLKDVNFYRSIQ